MTWFNPRTGDPVFDGGTVEGGAITALGTPPDTPEADWIVLVKNLSGGGGTNRAPVVSAGPDRSAFLTGDSVAITLNGSTSDDGLPDPFSLSRAWSFVSGPDAVSFSSASTSSTIATFTSPGTYILGLTVTDTEFTAHDEMAVTILLPQSGGAETLFPVHDAFLEEGVHENSEWLRVAAIDPLQVAYLQFDLTGLEAVPEQALLRLTEGGDSSDGEMKVRVFAGTSNDWTEATLDGATAPPKGQELASFTGNIPAGAVLEFDLGSHIAERGIFTFIIETDSPGQDVAFASKESPTAAARPALVVTLPPNTAPVFPGFVVSTQANTPVSLSRGEILAAASDADGDPLSLLIEDGSTTAGGEIVSGEEGFTYAPAIDYLGKDSFLLTIQDARGASASAILDITVIGGNGITGISPSVERVAGGAAIRFAGIPGYGYSVERSIDLINWSTLEPLLREPDGIIEAMDEEAVEDRVFYRITEP